MRGDEKNVLSRFSEILSKVQPDYFVRCTGDNPLTSSEAVNKLLSEELWDASNVVSIRDEDHKRLPVGLVPELVATRRFFEMLEDYGKLPEHHSEHVTSMVLETNQWANPTFTSEYNTLGHDRWRLTVDYREDYELVSLLVSDLAQSWPHSSYEQIIHALNANPAASEINSWRHHRSYLD